MLVSLFARVRFWVTAFRSGWSQIVRAKDHIDLIALLLVPLILGIGASAVLLFAGAFVPAIIILAVMILVLFMEGSFRTYQDISSKLATQNERLPLKVVKGDVDVRGGIAFLRLAIMNPNSVAVADCYGKAVEFYAAGGTVTSDYRGPPKGYNYPWSTYSAKSTLAPIGPGSTEYLDIAYSQGTEAKKAYIPHINELTQKIEPHFSVLAGVHRILFEIGSKTAPIPTRRYSVEFAFGGGVDFFVRNISELNQADS